MKIAGSGVRSGSVSQRYGPADTDPYRTVPKCHGSATLFLTVSIVQNFGF
jgi:hypothetical protein